MISYTYQTQSKTVLILERLNKMKVLQALKSYIGKGSEVKNVAAIIYLEEGMMIKPFEEAAIKLRKGKITMSQSRLNLDNII
jgi:hypothetical protein